MLRSILLVIFYLLFSLSSPADSVQVLARGSNYETDEWTTEPIYYYDSLRLPPKLSRSFLTMNLQAFYNQHLNLAFRYIGDWRDFDHGHLLKDSRGVLHGILFHTQERANLAPPGSKYAPVNKTKRNWLLFMRHPLEFRDAYQFRYSQKPAFWNNEYEKNVSWDQYEQAGTVVELMLDPEKTGFKIVPFMSQDKTESFYFKKTICPKAINSKSNIIEIINQQGLRECLYVTIMQCQFKHHFVCPGKLIPPSK